MASRAIPEGQGHVIPYLVIKNAAAAIEFYKKTLSATETFRLAQPDGRIGHAELKIGDNLIMLSDEHPEMGFVSPLSIGGARCPVGLHLYVQDVDTVYKRALEAGAKSDQEPADQFYGDRSARVTDPFGHVWYLSTHKEDVSPAEMKRRMDEMLKTK